MIDTTAALGGEYLLWEPDRIWDLPDIQGGAAGWQVPCPSVAQNAHWVGTMYLCISFHNNVSWDMISTGLD